MREEMTQEEFRGWQDAYSDDPWGEGRADQRTAANTLWNVAGLTKLTPPNLLYPYFEPDETPEEIDSQIAELDQAAESLKAQWQPASPNSPSS